MKTAALLACATVLCVLVAADRATAQSVPEKPAISSSVTRAAHALTVTWTAPSNTGGAAITAYDLRYVPSSTPDKDTDDTVWTVVQDVWMAGGGALSYQIAGLRDSTSHDIRVRAVNSAGDGPWSDVSAVATIDNEREVGQLNATHLVHIDYTSPSVTDIGDRDRLTFTVTEATRVWFYSTGPINTAIYLWRILPTQSNGPLVYNGASRWIEGLQGASIEYTLQPGITYLLSIGSFNGLYVGPVDVHTSILPEPGDSRANAPEVTLGRPVKGFIEAPGGASGEQEYFEFTLAETTDVWIVAYGEDNPRSDRPDYNIDTNIELQSSDGTALAMGDDGGWTGALWTSDIRRRLSAGTYYVRVWGDNGYRDNHHGNYELLVKEYQPPGNTRATATPITAYAYAPGHLSSASDKDYFRITLDSQRFVDFHISERGDTNNSANNPIFNAKYYDSGGVELPVAISRRQGLFYDNVQATARVRAPAGTSYIEVSANIGSGDYVILPVLSTNELQALDDSCDSGSQSDAFYTCQWHLNNTGQFSGGDGADINVEEVWVTNKGEGVTIAIVDNGVQLNHEDLRDNVAAGLSHDYHSRFQAESGASHGTGTAGIAAARDNVWGVRGVAPRAALYSLNLSYSSYLVSDMIDVLGRNAAVTGVSSNSWALVGAGKPNAPGVAWEMAAEQGATTGFGGKGIVYVHSGGNFHDEGDNANLNGLANFHTSVAVCAIGYNGKHPFYSELGANLWVCAPSTGSSGAGITTTDADNFYTRTFSGTSAAAPIVSGVVALVRAENTALTARDVKLILAASARKNDPTSSGWQTGALKYGSTSERYNYSHSYGFGAVDAGAAVELAKTWTLLPEQRTLEATSGAIDLSIAEARSDGSAGAATTTSLTLDPFVQFIEYIEVRVTSDHPSSRDLHIELRSPSGTVSTLAYPPTRNQFRFLPDQPVAFPEGFRFGSARHVGEDAAGAWTLTITDRLRGNTGSLTSWSIKAYGHGGTPEAPPAPTATAGMRSLTVDWEAPPDPDGDGPTITSYDLRYIRSSATATDKTDPANWTEVTGIGTDDTGTYEITGLGPGVQYDVQVRARSASGAGPWSESLVVRSTLEKPFAPSLIRVAPRDMGLGAEWNAPTEDGGSEITSYDLRTIRSDATEAEKLVDSNWAETLSAWMTGGGDLRGNATGLTNGVEYDVQVRAENAIGESDWSSEALKGTAAVQNTDPSFAEETTTREIAENARIGASVGSRVTATDSDRDTLTYSILGGHTLFEIDARTGQLRVKAALDHEDTAGPTHTITVEVSDGLNSSDDEDLTIDDSIEVTITVSDFDEPPEIEGEATYTIEENSPKLVGLYVATDPEESDTTWLRLSGTDARYFAFDADMGELSFVDTPDYDRATNGNHDETYDVTVRAYDGRNTATFPVTVTLTSIPEGPLIEGPAMVTVNEVIDPRPNQVVAVRAYTKRDPERSATNWGPVGSSEVLSGADNDAFAFDQQTGRLTFASPPDYEDGAQYTVTLTANDGTLDGRLDITVNVANLEERGMLTLGGVRQGANGQLLQATLTDPDGVATETWVWQRSTSRSGPWMDIANTDASSYTPTAADVGNYLRASVRYTDGAGLNETTLTKATELPTLNDASSNEPPIPPDPLPQVAPIPENASGENVVRVVFTDPESEQLTYSLVDSDEFAIVNPSSGQITVKSGGLDYENTTSHEVTVRAADPLGASATATLTVDVEDVNEPPTAVDLPVRILEDETVDIDVIREASDEDAGDTLTVAGVVRSPDKGGTTVNDGTNDITYKPHANYHGADSFTYRVNDARTLLSNIATVTITVMAVNDAPTFAPSPTTRSVSESAVGGDIVGAVTATDVEGDTLTYRLFGTGAFAFEIEPDSGQIKVGEGVTFDITMQDTYEVMVEANDGKGGTATVDVTITVTTAPVIPPPIIGGGGGFGGGGGGGGGGSGPSPSEADFEWTVKRDIEELDSGNDWPTGLWSDGATLWILENGQGADDDVYAYDPRTGERLEEREFTLADTNRAPRGIWSDRETVWVSDSGRDRVFAYTLASGARDESREIELAERNGDARGIWSDSETMSVLDGSKNALFAYDLGSGALLREYALASANGDARDLWSDGATVWVSDHGAKRLFAYRLPARPEAPAAEDAEAAPLEQVRDEEFTELSGASNNSPRGIWSDGDFMYVADESDDKVYTYNMPDALDARLASLTLSGVDIGEFDAGTTEYEGTPAEGVTETTVEASALQRRTDVAIDPPDADEAAEGHQIALDGISAITVTVTSADGTRTKVYRVNLAVPPAELALTPVWTAIEWPGVDAVAIAEAGLPDAVVAVYVWDEESRSWLGYFPGLEDVSGLNTLTTFSTAATYWIAVTEPVTWTVARGAQGEP